MRKRIVVVSVVIVIGAAGAAPAQVQRPAGPGAGLAALTSNQAHATPAQRARIIRAGSLAVAAKGAMNSGNYAEAEADARQSMAAGPDSGLAEDTLAAALYAQGKTQQALQVYRDLASQGDDFPRNLLPCALLLLKAGDWPHAASAYNKALCILDFGDLMRKSGGFSPGVPQPAELAAAIHIGMGLTLEGADFHGNYRDRITQGQAHFQKALALAPGSALANYYNGYGLQRLGRRAEAQAAFQKAAALDGGGVKKAAEEALKGR